MGRDTEYPLTPELEANLNVLLYRVNRLIQKYGQDVVVSSGYRPGHYNKKAGGAPNSSHTKCQAVDFVDIDRKLTTWILANPTILEEFDLYLENPADTPTWCHLQTRKVSRRIFLP